MNITTLTESFASAIAADTALLAWCNATYGRAHKVFIGFDRRFPPGAESAPFAIVYPASKTVGHGIIEKPHGIEIDCCVNDETISTFTQSNLTGFTGVHRIEEFRKLIETAIVAVDIGNALIDTIDIQYDNIESFPLHLAGMLVTIKEEWTSGSDPLE